MSFSIKVTKIPVLRLPSLTANDAQKIGRELIQYNKDRVEKGIGVNDQPMPKYSSRRIYVSVGGKGRASVTKKLRALKRAGLPIGRNRKNGTYVTESGSVSFPNRAAYKRALGRSGKRDLYETGAMQKDLTVLQATRRSIIIGFRNQYQAAKAAGNQNIAEWLGVSSKDETKVMKNVEEIIGRDIDKINHGG